MDNASEPASENPSKLRYIWCGTCHARLHRTVGTTKPCTCGAPASGFVPTAPDGRRGPRPFRRRKWSGDRKKHTVYLSDELVEKIERCRRDQESISDVIGRAVERVTEAKLR